MTRDDEIIKLLGSKETKRKGFEMLVNQYGEKLYWQVRRLVIVHEDADDVVQNVLIKAWTNIDEFQNRSKLYTWLSRIAINEALDFLRKKKNKTAVSADEDIVLASQLMADDYFDGDETQAQLQEAISSLPAVQRTVFNMRYFEELKYSEISKILNTSEGALKASYHLAVKKIEEFFKNHD